jgi:hypothetical protein
MREIQKLKASFFHTLTEMRPHFRVWHSVALDLFITLLGLMALFIQLTYDSKLSHSWPSGIINHLYQTNSSVSVNGTNNFCLYEDWQNYFYFWGFWSGMDQICNASLGLNDQNPWALTFWLSNHLCNDRSLGNLISTSRPLITALICFSVSFLLEVFALLEYQKHHFDRVSKLFFTVPFCAAKFLFLLGVAMYLLSVHNRNLASGDSMPNVLVGQLSAWLAFYLVGMLFFSFSIWHENPYREYEAI